MPEGLTAFGSLMCHAIPRNQCPFTTRKAIQSAGRAGTGRCRQDGFLTLGRTEGRTSLPEQPIPASEVVTVWLPTASLMATEVPAGMGFARSGLQSLWEIRSRMACL